ncbi:MAG: hypothetical protein CMH31_01835 [Micavibrio sp.]|nr:hypothetical protein [Micavibrio sp.]|tara:strand:- start:68 stop:859 length:792 start_codon:yes stop_codon:yes gene_type:complete
MPSSTKLKEKVEQLKQSIDLIALDAVIESYDYATDIVLTSNNHLIEEKLWNRIENYGEGLCNYGRTLSLHLRRVSLDGREFLMNELGFSAKAANNFQVANLFHDLGKTHESYARDIWNLPHRPTEKERTEKRLHTGFGTEIFLDAIKDLPKEAQEHPHLAIVVPALQLFHHERVDGKGYVGRQGHEMGKLIKALCIADCKDGDLVRRGHHVTQRTEKEALLRMKGLDDYDTNSKYHGAFDDMLDTYIAYREAQTGEEILPKTA